MAVPPEIIVTGPDGAVTRYKIADRAFVGRHPECEIVLTDPMSSRRHCKFEQTPAGTYIVEDQKSANGSLLNNEPLRPMIPTPMRNGDEVRIGSTTLLLRIDVAVRVEPTGAAVKYDEDDGGTDVSVINPADLKKDLQTNDVNALKRLAQRLDLLVGIGQALGQSLDLPKLLNTCMDKLFEVFPQSDRGLLLLYGPDGSLPPNITPESEWASVLTKRKDPVAMNRVRGSASASQMELKLSKTVLNKVRTEHQSVLIEKSGQMSLVDISSVMCAPLLIGKLDLGLLYLETKKALQAFNKDDVGVMTAVAGQIAVVIRNSDLAHEAAAQAAHRENLSRFLSPNLVEQMLKGKLSVELGGTTKKGTIFFSDIVGFTKLASKMKADEVVALLNRYFTVMQNIIFKRGGSIDKCAGDAIMAHWGVVGDIPDFTTNAVTSAIEMQIALFAFNRDEAKKAEIKLPPSPLGHGIGLNTGMICAGNIGSDRKIEFTVIGDAVNLSSRIESMAGRFHSFVGAPTWEEIMPRAFAFRMPDCPVKNVEHPLPIYSVRGIVPPPPIEGPQTATANADLTVDDLLLSLPCRLVSAESEVAGMVTRISRAAATEGAKLVIQAEKPILPGTAVTLHWNVSEKPSLPPLEGEIEKCWSPDAPMKPIGNEAPLPNPSVTATTPAIGGNLPPRGGTAVLLPSLTYGTIVFSAKVLPDDIAAIKPGGLIQCDLKTADDIVRL